MASEQELTYDNNLWKPGCLLHECLMTCVVFSIVSLHIASSMLKGMPVNCSPDYMTLPNNKSLACLFSENIKTEPNLMQLMLAAFLNSFYYSFLSDYALITICRLQHGNWNSSCAWPYYNYKKSFWYSIVCIFLCFQRFSEWALIPQKSLLCQMSIMSVLLVILCIRDYKQNSRSGYLWFSKRQRFFIHKFVHRLLC